MTNKDGISVEGVRALLEGTTPEPWFQGQEAGHPDWNGDSESAHKVWPDEGAVGRLIARAGLNFTGWVEQDAANAALIAAAPSIARTYLALSEREVAKDAEIARLTQALQDVANPLAMLKREAEARGNKLSGMAYSIANDLGTVQGIARAALTQGKD